MLRKSIVIGFATVDVYEACTLAVVCRPLCGTKHISTDM